MSDFEHKGEMIAVDRLKIAMSRRGATIDLADVASALSRIERLEMIESSWLEFMAKTDWVQTASVPDELGKHRADVLKGRIDRLTAERDDWRRQAQYETDVAEVAAEEIRRLREILRMSLGVEVEMKTERDAAVAALDRIVSLKMSMFADPCDMAGECVNIAAGAIDAARSEGGV